MLPCVLEEGPAIIECPSLRRGLTKEVARLEMQIETLKQSRNLLWRARMMIFATPVESCQRTWTQGNRFGR